MSKSLFMNDSSRSNHGYEAMLDFQISWLLRLAKEPVGDYLHLIARGVLCRLTKLDKHSNVTIKRVDVWKQWEHIDLTAEIEVEIGDQLQRHLVVIEDKAYTMIHDDQLTRYRETVDSYYRGKGKNTYEKHFWVISFFDREEDCFKTLEKQAKNANWELLSFYEVIDWNKEMGLTGSDLFDEFWLKEWY